ncbi:MAG TPA: SRPBCC domain-containing protein [Ferruginibacter sp.]|nr:SRPBCC domain-containing protein [Ferruginibacter sp.]
MEKINFSASINAPREKIWKILWDDATYRQWTTPFCEGSYAQTDNWKEGTKVLFLSPGQNGMVSSVAANRPNEFMSFEHHGEMKEGVEDTTSDKVKEWAGAKENYTLKENGGVTELTVEMDINDDFKQYFQDAWPKAMAEIKRLSEN